MNFFETAHPASVGLDETLETVVDQTVQNDIAAGEIVGAAVGIFCQGKCVYKKNHGYANTEPKIPLRDDHLFRMASMTKPITAVCVLKQMEEGKLSLDDPAGKFIPKLMHMNVMDIDDAGNILGSHPAQRPITVRDLLSHSSGIGSGDWQDKLNCNMSIPNGYVLGDKMDDWAASYLAFEPGSRAKYSWLVGFDILAHIIELTSDMPYADFAEKYVFRPLGMTDTVFHPSEEQWNRLVTMHTKISPGVCKPYPNYERQICGCPPSYHSGAAGVVSSLNDYSRFAHMLCSDGVSGGVRILKSSTVQEMRSRQLPLGTRGTDDTLTWGLGVRVALTDFGLRKFWTAGTFSWSGAFGTHFWCDPTHQLFAVFCSNTTTSAGADAITARHIEKAVLDCMGDLK